MGGFGSTSRQFSEQVGNKVMIKFVRLAALAAATVAVATPAFAQTRVNNGPVNARAQITKPLTLSKLTPTSDLDFGEIIVTGTDTVRLNPVSGLRECGAVANQTCQGAFSFAEYRVTGTNNQDVTVDTPDVLLSNTSGAGSLTLVLEGPGTVNLTNAGSVGNTFVVGGSININEATPEGIYTGVLDITVEY